MTLPASGAISLNDVRVELGRAATAVALGDTDVRNLAGIATGAISLGNLYGRSAAGPVLAGKYIDNVRSTGTATAEYGLQSNGLSYQVSGTTTTYHSGEWWSVGASAGIGGGYEVRATLTSGSAPSVGTLNSWQPLSTNQLWRNTRGSAGSQYSQLFIEIRVTGGAVVASATIQLNAERSA